MKLIETQGRMRKLTSLILTTAMVFSMFLGMNLDTSAATTTVTIKTQDKADSLIGSGAIRGIDVSKWQGKINWSKVAADEKNIKFAFVRANYGAENDPTFVENINGAHENGIKVGAYHYARFKSTETMENEAEQFINQLKKVKVTYPVVLDVENHYGLSKNELTSLCMSFIEKLEKQGYSVMLYTYQNFLVGHLNVDKLGKTKVWIANYKEYPATIEHHIWQHTSSAKVSGISTNVDINIAYKDLSLQKPIEVDGKISKNIITFLNETLGANLSTDSSSVDVEAMYYWLSTGIQRDLAKNFDNTIAETGALNMNDINLFITLSGKDITSNNIMKYIQARLFYKGFYKQELTGKFDEHTVEAIKDFQASNGIDAVGALGKNTMKKLFNVSDEATPTTSSKSATSSAAPATTTSSTEPATTSEGPKVVTPSTTSKTTSVVSSGAKNPKTPTVNNNSDSDTLDG